MYKTRLINRTFHKLVCQDRSHAPTPHTQHLPPTFPELAWLSIHSTYLAIKLPDRSVKFDIVISYRSHTVISAVLRTRPS